MFQHLVHSLKYNAMTLFGIELGRRIGVMLKENIDVQSIDGIVPIPLHKLKQRERGYNQSEFICERNLRRHTAAGCFHSCQTVKKHRLANALNR